MTLCLQAYRPYNAVGVSGDTMYKMKKENWLYRGSSKVVAEGSLRGLLLSQVYPCCVVHVF